MPNIIEAKEKIYCFGGAATAGAVMAWFKDTLGWEEKEAERITGIDAYRLLEIEAEKIPPGSDGLILLPYFMGERSPIWDGDARGNLLGLSLYHTKPHIYKAFMEGVAYALRHNMEIIGERDDIQFDETLTLVGGVTKSNVFPKSLLMLPASRCE